MQKTCTHCSAAFEITTSDLKFYEDVSPVIGGQKMTVPPPGLCPDCRCQRRLLFRNDLCLYHRKSDLSGKQIVSIYAPDKPYKVYDQDEWWSDRWNAQEYGRPFDFSKTFTEQFAALNDVVPHAALFTTNAENSYFTNHSLNAKNTYLIAGATNIEDSYYGRFVIDCKDIVDGLSLFNCQWCYECTACQGCYQCQYALYSYNCSNCLMVEDCQNCKNCALCFGLKNQEYCLLNERLGKEAYEQRLKELKPLTLDTVALLRERFVNFKHGLPHRSSYIFGSDDCTGDMVFGSRNCRSAFDCSACEDCAYISNTPKGYKSQDGNYTAPDGIRWCYNVGSTVGIESAIGTFLLWYGGNAYYSRECHHCTNIFGCLGLRQKKFCILNRQYTEEEYNELVPKIVDHMRKAGEWGDYLNPSLSTMGYNETLAHEYFPLTKEQVGAKGWKWYTELEKKDAYMGPSVKVPATIADVSDDLCEQILICETSGKPYKIIPKELKFYRTMGLPVPRTCPDQRHKQRMALRNPRKLWNRTCAKCHNKIETTYSPDRPEVIYCEECYLKEVY